MEYTSFVIENYRGIRKLTLDLVKKQNLKVFCLVGLNESGKTTILDAINNMGRRPHDFKQEDPSKSTILPIQYQSYIPVAKRYNFTGEILLTSKLRLSESDRDLIIRFLEDDLGFKVIMLADEFTIIRKFTYQDSKYIKTSNTWSLVPIVKKKRGKKVFRLDSQTNNQNWLKLANFVEPMIPQILYFKNEVFDIPDRILISSKNTPKSVASTESSSQNKSATKSTKQPNEFYRDVVQDILSAIDPDLLVETHIVNRKRSGRPEDSKSLSGLLQKMGQHVTVTVMRQWETIFGRKLIDKRVQVSCDIDTEDNIFLLFKLEDGGEIFDITERSTGFRWFFLFILLTHYRGFRIDSALFLYDEPASNLHASAQGQLLDCFSKLPDAFKVIYSTHSHHLINPHWLDSVFIIKNEAITYEENDLDVDAAKTDITAVPYRKFASENPSNISYFQPILDVLKYVPSGLEGIRPAILLEGKSDFYVLTYLTKIVIELTPSFDLVPCAGSGTADSLIALYSG